MYCKRCSLEMTHPGGVPDAKWDCPRCDKEKVELRPNIHIICAMCGRPSDITTHIAARQNESNVGYTKGLESLLAECLHLMSDAEKMGKFGVEEALKEFGYDSIRFKDVRHGRIVGRIEPKDVERIKKEFERIKDARIEKE